jgi:RHS repeat-associated protein
VQYRAWGGIKRVDYGNALTLSADYDSRTRLTRWDVTGVLGYQYSYNHFYENSWHTTFASQLYDHTEDRSYDYDQAGRLTASYTGTSASAHVGAGSTWGSDGPYAQTYGYDKWGNITGRNGTGAPNSQYSYAPQFVDNKMTVNPITGAAIQYDSAGNLTNDGAQIFTYDATGQQTSASSTGLQQSYDGDGLRIKKTENGVTTYYVRSSVLGGQVLAEATGSGAFRRGYVYMGSQLLALQESNQVMWTHQDPVTKSQRLTNSAGTVVSWVELDPWGAETGGSNNAQQQSHRYNNYERDANGGDDATMRRYEGRWQRFAQPDPYDGSYNLAEPQSFNRYSYTQNDPVNFADPTGLTDDPPPDCGQGREARRDAQGVWQCVGTGDTTVTVNDDPPTINWDDLPGAGGHGVGGISMRMPQVVPCTFNINISGASGQLLTDIQNELTRIFHSGGPGVDVVFNQFGRGSGGSVNLSVVNGFPKDAAAAIIRQGGGSAYNVGILGVTPTMGRTSYVSKLTSVKAQGEMVS